MDHDVSLYAKRCHVYQVGKCTSSNVGYTPLPIFEGPWINISIDFVIGLPRTTHDWDVIFVIVERFTKMAHFIVCRMTTNAAKVANMFYATIVRYHGIHKSIVFDRDTHFMNSFWKSL